MYESRDETPSCDWMRSANVVRGQICDNILLQGIARIIEITCVSLRAIHLQIVVQKLQGNTACPGQINV